MSNQLFSDTNITLTFISLSILIAIMLTVISLSILVVLGLIKKLGIDHPAAVLIAILIGIILGLTILAIIGIIKII